MKYYVDWAGETREIDIVSDQHGTRVTVDGVPHTVDAAATEDGGLLNLIVDGRSVTVGARFEDGHAVLSFHDREVRLRIEDERQRQTRLATGGGRRGAHESEVKSVMPGVVKEVRVATGDRVEAGAALLILEAMKMENEIRAPATGIVKSVHVEAGQAVDKGARLVELAPDTQESPTPAAVGA